MRSPLRCVGSRAIHLHARLRVVETFAWGWVLVAPIACRRGKVEPVERLTPLIHVPAPQHQNRRLGCGQSSPLPRCATPRSARLLHHRRCSPRPEVVPTLPSLKYKSKADSVSNAAFRPSRVPKMDDDGEHHLLKQLCCFIRTLSTQNCPAAQRCVCTRKLLLYSG